MKKFTLLLFNLFFAFGLNAQHWSWAKAGNSSVSSEGWSVSADAAGNVFATGWFNSPKLTLGSATITNAGNINFFIVKYDANGNVLWAKSTGGANCDASYSITAVVGGDAIVTGFFTSPTITFGSVILVNADPSGKTSDIFLARYDANGNLLWAKRAGGSGYDIAYSICADTSGNAFITGYFDSSVINFSSTKLINAGIENIFITKYDAVGNVLWAKSAGGTNHDCGYSVSADKGGNVFLTGEFDEPSINFGSTILTNAGSENIFIVKYDSAGKVLWAQSAGGANSDYGYSISADAGGNLFLTGEFASPTITFGTATLTNTNAGSADMFIAKYNANGNVLWAQNATGTANDAAYSVSADAAGNVYVSGGFYSNAITFGSVTLTKPAGSPDPMFVVKYDANGNVYCASALASGGDDNNSVSADPFGNAFIGGDFMAVPVIVGNDTFTPTGAENFFIAKYNCIPGAQTAINELNYEKDISVFPNPTSGKLQIESSQKKISLAITNILGEKVYSAANSQIDTFSPQGVLRTNFQIDLSPQPKGIYFVEIISGEKRETQKIILE